MNKLIIQFILFLFCGIVHAQEALNNNGSLHIHTGASMTIVGNFSNASTATLVNNGSFFVRGNINNHQSSMASGTGTLYLNGNVGQSVNGTQVFRTLNLVTDNTAGITLNNNLIVSGAHVYTNGIITTSATPNYLVYESGSSYSGQGDSRHVNGWVKKLGSTDFSFPVGNGTLLRSAAIESLSGSLEFNGRYLAPTPNTTSVQLPLVLVDPNEYWVINRVDAGGSARIHLNWENAKVAFPQYVLSSIRVGYFTGGLWTDEGGSASGDINTTGDITSNALSAFGSFTFASTEFLIPLQFLGITAQRKSGYNLVEWRTADAFNTDHFQIERSEDGIHFEKIGTTASYNISSVMSYSFRDVNVQRGTVWYRVRSVDIDGEYKLSAIVSVRDVQELGQWMYVLNNPVQGSVNLYAPQSYRGEYEYTVSSTGGQLLQRGRLTVRGAGNISIKLNGAISPGVYILYIKNDRQQFRERILVK